MKTNKFQYTDEKEIQIVNPFKIAVIEKTTKKVTILPSEYYIKEEAEAICESIKFQVEKDGEEFDVGIIQFI